MENKQRIVVVGACGGIGRATTQLLAASGCSLALIDQHAADLDALRREIGANDTLVATCSITDGTAVREAFQHIAGRWSSIDGLVNAAGVFSFASAAETSEAEWRRTVDINLTGTFLCCQAAIPLLAKSRAAHIVNVLSIASTEAFENQAAYCASKAGALAMSRVLALELAPRGIGVSCINPGAVDTPLWDSSPAGFDRKAMLQASDVARSIQFVLQQAPNAVIREIVITPAAGTL